VGLLIDTDAGRCLRHYTNVEPRGFRRYSSLVPGGVSPLTRAKTPYLPTYPQAAQRSEKR